MDKGVNIYLFRHNAVPFLVIIRISKLRKLISHAFANPLHISKGRKVQKFTNLSTVILKELLNGYLYSVTLNVSIKEAAI